MDLGVSFRGLQHRYSGMLRAVIPAKAGIHFAFGGEGKVDSRFRGNDGEEVARHRVEGTPASH